jgi:hypothetical protein
MVQNYFLAVRGLRVALAAAGLFTAGFFAAVFFTAGFFSG